MFKRLHKSTLVDILSEWIECRDLARLDTAVASPRDVFLDLLKCPSMSITTPPSFKIFYHSVIPMITWINNRSLKPNTWTNYINVFLVTDFSKVLTCTFPPYHYTNAKYILFLLDSMPLLTNISIGLFNLASFRKILANKDITDINIIQEPNVRYFLLPALISDFKQCRRMTFGDYDVSCTSSILKNSNSNITVFDYKQFTVKYTQTEILITEKTYSDNTHCEPTCLLSLIRDVFTEAMTITIQFKVQSSIEFLETKGILFRMVSNMLYNVVSVTVFGFWFPAYNPPAMSFCDFDFDD